MPCPISARLTTLDAARLQQHLASTCRRAAFLSRSNIPSMPLLRTLYDDVLYRDIATRYRIDDVRALKELAFYLMSNPASPISFNKLKEQFRLGSVNTIKNYIEYLENSWLVFTTNVYDYSVKRQQIAPKKVYAIDTGLANAVGFAFSANTGRLLENLVFLALRRQTPTIHYYRSPAEYEVDFYLPKTRQLIQVTQSLAAPAVREREVRALTEAMRTLGLARGLILTDANAEPIETDGLTIEVRSVAHWLLETGWCIDLNFFGDVERAVAKKLFLKAKPRRHKGTKAHEALNCQGSSLCSFVPLCLCGGLQTVVNALAE